MKIKHEGNTTEDTEDLKEESSISKWSIISFIQRYSYFVGTYIIRRFRIYKRVYKNIYRVVTNRFSVKIKSYYTNIKSNLISCAHYAALPVKMVYTSINEYKKLREAAIGLTGIEKQQAISAYNRYIIESFFYIIKTFINYIAPVLALYVLFLTVNYYNNLVYALRVEYNGEHIGYINSESEFLKAEGYVKGRIIYEDYIRPMDSVPRFTLEVVEKEEIVSVDNLTNKLIYASGNMVEQANGLYVDNKFYGATPDVEGLLNVLDTIKERYSTGNPDEKISFVKKVEVKKGLYPLTSIAPLESLELEISGFEQEQRIYKTQKNDAPSIIAKKHNMNYADLLTLNPTIEKKLLIGQDVIISKAVPVLGVKISTMETYIEETPFNVERTATNEQPVGYVQITQGGKKGQKEIVADVTYVDGIEVERVILNTTVINEPVTEKIIVGSNQPEKFITTVANPSGSYIWPVDGGQLSVRIWGYWNHTGMDIRAPYGTAVRAVAAGTVVVSKNMVYDYGKYIVIDHGGGLQTLYAHNSALHVKVGDWVDQGQLIASIGSTGRSTGPHCHLEFRQNGRFLDPGLYVGYKYNR